MVLRQAFLAEKGEGGTLYQTICPGERYQERTGPYQHEYQAVFPVVFQVKKDAGSQDNEEGYGQGYRRQGIVYPGQNRSAGTSGRPCLFGCLCFLFFVSQFISLVFLTCF